MTEHAKKNIQIMVGTDRSTIPEKTLKRKISEKRVKTKKHTPGYTEPNTTHGHNYKHHKNEITLYNNKGNASTNETVKNSIFVGTFYDRNKLSNDINKNLQENDENNSKQQSETTENNSHILKTFYDISWQHETPTVKEKEKTVIVLSKTNDDHDSKQGRQLQRKQAIAYNTREGQRSFFVGLKTSTHNITTNYRDNNTNKRKDINSAHSLTSKELTDYFGHRNIRNHTVKTMYDVITNAFNKTQISRNFFPSLTSRNGRNKDPSKKLNSEDTQGLSRKFLGFLMSDRPFINHQVSHLSHGKLNTVSRVLKNIGLFTLHAADILKNRVHQNKIVLQNDSLDILAKALQRIPLTDHVTTEKICKELNIIGQRALVTARKLKRTAFMKNQLNKLSQNMLQIRQKLTRLDKTLTRQRQLDEMTKTTKTMKIGGNEKIKQNSLITNEAFPRESNFTMYSPPTDGTNNPALTKRSNIKTVENIQRSDNKDTIEKKSLNNLNVGEVLYDSDRESLYHDYSMLDKKLDKLASQFLINTDKSQGYDINNSVINTTHGIPTLKNEHNSNLNGFTTTPYTSHKRTRISQKQDKLDLTNEVKLSGHPTVDSDQTKYLVHNSKSDVVKQKDFKNEDQKNERRHRLNSQSTTQNGKPLKRHIANRQHSNIFALKNITNAFFQHKEPNLKFSHNTEHYLFKYNDLKDYSKNLTFSNLSINYIQKSTLVQLNRAVGDDSKLNLSHSSQRITQSLEMLNSSKDANTTVGSIQNTTTDRKRDRQIDHPTTTLTLHSEKQKQTLRKVWKTRTKT